MKNRNYFDEIIEIARNVCSEDDYLDKDKGKKHDRAMKKFEKIAKELEQVDCNDMLVALLQIDEEKVKLITGSLCLKLKVLTQFAIAELEKVVKSRDSSLSYTAYMTIKMFKQGRL